MNKATYLIVLIALVLMSSSAFAYERIPNDKVIFAASLTDAKLEAKERNCPIFVFIHEGD